MGDEISVKSQNLPISESGSASVELENELDRVRKVARFLDSQLALPGGIRIGADGLIGLIPGVGDLATGAISLWIVLKARQLGVPKKQLAMMMTRVGADSLLGAIPLVGDFFDFFYKANLKNAQLLIEHLEKQIH